MRRRNRQADPLASVTEIREVIEELRERISDPLPSSEKDLERLFNAVRHIERHPSGASRSGRPSHFPREMLLDVARHLKAVLARRYGERISPATFIAFCLPILNYPPDLIEALEQGELTRLEASLLARLTPERLGVKPRKALSIRQEAIRNHIRVQGSQTQLQRRVAELLGGETLLTSENMTAAVHEIDDLLSVEEDDRRHLFYEQMKEFFFAMRDIQPEEVDDQTLEEILEASDRLMTVIHRIRLRRKQRAEREKTGQGLII